MRTIITFFCVAACSAAWGDIITLRNGDRIVADSVHESNGRVEYTIGENTYAIPKSHVVKIETGQAPEVPVLPRAVSSADLPSAGAALEGGIELSAQVVRNGQVNQAALKAIENEGIPEKTAAAYSMAAFFEDKQNDLASAARYLQVALLFLPHHSILLENYASTLLRLDKAAEALTYAQQAVQANPRSADAYAILGFAWYKNDHNREAIEAWKKSLELHPDPKLQAMLARVERETKAEAEFHQQESSHFTLRYEGSRTPGVLRKEILTALESHYKDLESDLGASPQSIFVSLYTDQAFFDVTQAPSWTAALNDGKIRVPVSGLTGVSPSLNRVLRHELTHSFVSQIAHGHAPQWLNEGIAQIEEGSTTAPMGRNLAALYSAGRQVPLNQLESNFITYSNGEASVAYAESLAAVEYIRVTYGQDEVAQILRGLGQGQSMETALRGTIRLGYAQLETEIANYLARNYGKQ
ncbi:MAG TPA: peptidase MA family metallohydrolase [Alphaproteobacteria bacterium]|nr:peptidase MA family metallohydrolase [Alphaproteobacteria bacterium]